MKESELLEEVEITCEVFQNIPEIIEILKAYEFNYVEEFTLDDIYMENTNSHEFSYKDEKIRDTLIIRYVNEKDKKIICKKRNYDDNGIQISTDKTILKVKDIEEAEKFLNKLGYNRYLRMIDKNYKYQNKDYIAYIQEVEDLGIFLELEAKNKNIMPDTLIKYIQKLGLKIGTEFDIRKAEKLYKKIKEKSVLH